jgi:hypothetical protein
MRAINTIVFAALSALAFACGGDPGAEYQSSPEDALGQAEQAYHSRVSGRTTSNGDWSNTGAVCPNE